MSIRESMQATTATWRVGSTWRPASGKSTANAWLAVRNSSAMGMWSEMWSDMLPGRGRGRGRALLGRQAVPVAGLCPGTRTPATMMP